MNFRHGYCVNGEISSEYRAWAEMLQRCENPNKPAYKNYGGRGIKVCERWHRFENFYEDMGQKPRGLTLERKNNDDGYCPRNCTWATWKEQQNNKRPISYGPFKQFWFFAFNENNGQWQESNSQNAFAQKFGLNVGNISSCLSGRRISHKGWKFYKL